MSAPYTGHCACGAVHAVIGGEPVRVGSCWCRQCQQVAGGGATYNAMFLAADCNLTGFVAERSYRAASGNTLTLGFCKQCFAPVSIRSAQRPQFLGLRLGFLDEGHGLRPGNAIWLAEAPDWACIDPALDHYPAQPPAPTAKA
ncbi:MAG: GFA family protein [Sphingomonadales bacterium]|nr:GFA family protein [Sphingomonadales bacterium]